MKLSRVMFNADAEQPSGSGVGQQPANSSTPATVAAPSISELVDKLLQANTQRSTASSTATVITVQVKAVSDWRPTANGNLPTKMVVTDKGNFWPLANAIKNCPKSFGKPVAAKATLVLRKDKDGNDRLNLSQLEFEEAMDNRTFQMIAALPQGAALFGVAI